MLRALLYQRGPTIAQSMTDLNRMIAVNGLLEGFATLFVGAYDRKQGHPTYVNAGQEPGLIRRATTDVIEELKPTGPVLGGYFGAVYTERVVSLAKGDTLALFTDGLTEAGPNLIDLLDLEGVTEIFRTSTDSPASLPHEITARIMANVKAAVTPAGIRDDVCLLVACVK